MFRFFPGMQRKDSSAERLLLQVTDPNLYDILFRFLVNIALPDDDGSNFYQILSTIKFPLLDLKTINKVSCAPLTGYSISERLAPVKSYFVFNQDLLLEFYKYINDDIVKKPSSTIILYYIVISWNCHPNLEDSESCFPQLVSIISKFRQIINSPLYHYIFNTVCTRYMEVSTTPISQDLIELIFQEINEYNFEFASEMLGKTVLNRDTDSFLYLTNLFNSCISANPDRFANLDLQILVSTLYQNMMEFEETPLSILSTLGAVVKDTYLIEAIRDLPSHLCHKLKPAPNSFCKPEESEFIQIDIKCITREFSFSPETVDLFPDGIDEFPPSAYDTTVSFDDLISNEDKKVLKSIILSLSRMDDVYSDVFFTSFVQYVDDNSYILFLYILAHIRKIKITDQIFVKLFVVFQPGITVFNPPKIINQINFYRKTVLYILSIHDPVLIGRLIQLNEEHPLLLADIIGRINNKLSLYDLSILTDDNIIGILINTYSVLTQLVTKEIEIPTSRKALVSVIVFIFALLENKIAAARCFLSPIFASGFLSRVLEPSMQKPIISALHTFLTEYSNTDISLLSPLVEFICGILGVCRSLPKHDRLSSIVIDILNCVNDSIAHNTAITNCFSPILTPATYYLVENPSKELLNEVLYLSTLLVDETTKFHISNEAAALLSAAARAAESETVSDTTICGLLTIIANSRAASPKVMFLMKEYTMINVLISVLRTEKQFIEIIDLLQQLCKHSLHNCRVCHKGELDLLLLEIIKNHDKEFTFRNIKYSIQLSKDKVVEVILPMITTISSFISSPQVVMSLLSVISPDSDRGFSDFAVSAMKEIGSSLGLVMQAPKVITPLGDPSISVDISGVKSNHINGGFTIQFWLQNDCPAALMSTRCPQIIQINDSEDIIFRLHLSGTSILCNIFSSNGLSYAALSQSMPSCTWFVATVAVNIADRFSTVSLYINGKLLQTYSVALSNFHEGSIGIRIGGVASNPEDAPFDCRIGDVWFFGECLDKKTIQEMNMIGARASDVGTFAIFSYPPTVFASGITTKLNKGPMELQQSLLEMFTARVTDLVPFFAYMDTMPPHFPPQLIDLIQCIIPNLNANSVDIFPLVAALLMNAPPAKLTYSLYQKFFTIIEKCNSSAIARSLISNILFNPELWCVCEARDLSRIVAHWSNALFSTSPSTFMSCITISQVLAIMRLYFYYTPIEIEIIRANGERKRPANLDIEQCRTNLSRLVFSMSVFKFTTKDAVCIISHCSTCSDVQQVINLMCLLTDIVKSNKVDFPPHVSKLVYHQMKPASEERFVTAVKLLYAMSVKDFFLVHINSIVSLISGAFITEKLYESLLQIFKTHHLIYPLMILLANALDKLDSFTDELSQIEFTHEEATILVQNEMWAFWLILMVVNGTEKCWPIIRDMIIKVFFVKPQITIIDDIFIIIDLFANISDFCVEEFGRTLCETIVPLIASLEMTKLNSLFIRRCIKYLFFRINGPNTTDALQSLFESSPYSLFDVTNSVSTLIREQRLLTADDIREAFSSKFELQNYKFMLRMDDAPSIQDKNLFASTLALLQNLPHFDDEMKFWTRYLISLNEPIKRSKELTEEVNEFLPGFYESMNRQFIIGLQNFRNILKQIMETGKSQCVNSFISMKTSDVGLSSFDIDVYLQTINITNQMANRAIRRFCRQNSYTNTTWKYLCEMKPPSRSFSNCLGFTQPILKIPSSNSLVNSEQLKTPNEIEGVALFNCLHVRVKGEQAAALQIFPDKIVLTKVDKIFEIQMKDISCVLVRNRLHRSNSLEIFYQEQKSLLLDFSPLQLSNVLPVFMKYQIRSVQTVSMQNYFPQLSFTKMWVNREMTNFEYLMRLNIFTGRTYHDLSLYPIMPWVVMDMKSEMLDLTNSLIFRNFSKSIVDQNGFMYMTAPVNPSYVKYFLGQIPPFDTADNSKFSLGKFESVEKTIEKIVSGMNSVELTPEFFYSPEYFTNIELPKWAKNAYEFVYYNRKALESEYVSQHLHEWIDIIFGYKSRGKDGTNIYNPVLYEDVWSSWTETNAETIQNTLKTAGHMPPMIFQSPHPMRNSSKTTSALTVPFNYSLERTDFIATSMIISNYEFISYVSICSDGEVVRYSVNIETPQRSTFTSLGYKFPPKKKHWAALRMHRALAIADGEKGTITIFSEKGVDEINVGPFNLQRSASDVNTLLISSHSGDMYLWKPGYANLKKLAGNYSDYTTQVAVSEGYSISVAGTKSGTIICNTTNSTFLWCTAIGNIPLKMIITRLWGFVLCQCNRELVLLSLNGNLLKRCDIDFTVAAWCTWEEYGGDYVAIADDKGRIRVFEVFKLELGDIVFNCRCQVLAINYIKESAIFSIITQDGHCRLLPRDLCPNL